MSVALFPMVIMAMTNTLLMAIPLFTFMGLGDSDEVNGFLRANISRMTKKYSNESLSERDVDIGGELLHQIG